MDLDYLKKLVDASIEECEATNDTGAAYDALKAYLDNEIAAPHIAKLKLVRRELEQIAEQARALETEHDALMLLYAEAKKTR